LWTQPDNLTSSPIFSIVFADKILISLIYYHFRLKQAMLIRKKQKGGAIRSAPPVYIGL